MDEHAKRSEDRRREYKRRLRQARLDGGRSPGDAERADLLGKAREIIKAYWARMSDALRNEPSPYNSEPREWLPPGHVAVRAETVLGFEVELADVLANREAIEQHRMSLLGLMSRAREGVARASMPDGEGNVDLFKLEHALATGEGLPRDAERQLLAVVRELIRWRAAVPATGRSAADASPTEAAP